MASTTASSFRPNGNPLCFRNDRLFLSTRIPYPRVFHLSIIANSAPPAVRPILSLHPHHSLLHTFHDLQARSHARRLYDHLARQFIRCPLADASFNLDWTRRQQRHTLRRDLRHLQAFKNHSPHRIFQSGSEASGTASRSLHRSLRSPLEMSSWALNSWLRSRIVQAPSLKGVTDATTARPNLLTSARTSIPIPSW